MEFLPPLSHVVGELTSLLATAATWVAIRDTVVAWGLGLAIAAVVVGLTVGSVPFLQRALASTFDFLRPIPSVVLIPVIILIFNVGLGSTLVLVVYSCFWVMLFQVLYGLRSVDPVAKDMFRSCGVGRLCTVLHLTYPSVLPYLATGFRLAASVALALTATAGLVIGTPGLGRAIWMAKSGDNIPMLYALIVLTGLLGVVINALVLRLERCSIRQP